MSAIYYMDPKNTMTIDSPYITMVAGGKLLPIDGYNIKLLFRHSLRPPLKGTLYPDNILLSDEGINLARRLGASFDIPIGECHSSFVPRCIQTIESILYGANQDSKIEVSNGVLSDGFFSDKTIASKTFRETSLKAVVLRLVNGETPNGFISVDIGVKSLLDYIFTTGNHTNTIDLYCTHDFQLSLLDSLMYNKYNDIMTIEERWPNMLEGMWFWGKRNNFYCIWRGNCRHFVNYVL